MEFDLRKASFYRYNKSLKHSELQNRFPIIPKRECITFLHPIKAKVLKNQSRILWAYDNRIVSLVKMPSTVG